MLRVNDAYCRMVQKSRAELEGQLLTIVHSEANADFVLSTYQKRVDSNTLVPHLETEVTLWNGAKVWFELSNSLLEVPGKPPCVLSIFRDITARKQTEAELARHAPAIAGGLPAGRHGRGGHQRPAQRRQCPQQRQRLQLPDLRQGAGLEGGEPGQGRRAAAGA